MMRAAVLGRPVSHSLSPILHRAAYAELWFTPIFWPDFSREVLFEAIRDVQKRSRRFGAVSCGDD